MTDWMNLLCWYIFIIMLCDRVTSAQPNTVSSLIYICCILHYFSKWTTYFRRSETSFSYLFRSEWKWIIYFPTSPKETVKLSKKSRNKHCSYREVRAYKHKWCYCFYVSQHESGTRKIYLGQKPKTNVQQKISGQYNVTTRIEQMQDKKKH